MNDKVRQDKEQIDREALLALRRAAIMLVVAIESALGLEPSLSTKRERRKHP